MNEKAPFFVDPSGWFHVCNVGEFPHAKGMQVIQSQDLQSMVENFKKPLLIDYDHLSHDPSQKTEAAGWVDQLETRNGGSELWAKARWSSEGLSKLEGGVYRFQSPVFNVRKESNGLFPEELVRVALTNDPNLKGLTPLSNRRADVPTPTQGKEVMKNKTLLELTVLPENATDAQIEKGIVEIQGRLVAAEQTETRNRELENEIKALRESQIESDLNDLSDEEKAAWRPILLNNRESGLKALSLSRKTKKEKGSETLSNRFPAQTPAEDKKEKSQMQLQQEAIAAEMIANRTHTQAYEAAKAKHPELFKQ
jgi:phage I-like protein